MKTNTIYLISLILFLHLPVINNLAIGEYHLENLEEKQTPIEIINKQNNLCITSEIGNTFLSKCQGLDSQLWFEEITESNLMVLFNRENGMVLASKTDKNQEVIESEIYRATKNQFFLIQTSEKFKDFFTIKNSQTSLCLQIKESSNTKLSIQNRDCNTENEAQLFQFTKFNISKHQNINVKPIGQYLIHEKTGLCVSRNKYTLRLQECNGETNQLWFYEKNGGNYMISGDLMSYYICEKLQNFSKNLNDIEDDELTIAKEYNNSCLFMEIKSKKNPGLISLKNISAKTCLASNDKDIYDIRIKNTECEQNSEEQLLKFVDLNLYDFFNNKLYEGSKKFPFILQWVYLKNSHTNTCLKFNGKDQPVTHENCQNNEAFQWKIININKRRFYIVTKFEDFVLAPLPSNSSKEGTQIIAVNFDKNNLKEEDYIKLRATSNRYKEFRLEFEIDDLCFQYDKKGPIVTQEECFCVEDKQRVIPELIKPQNPKLNPSKDTEKPMLSKPILCYPPMVHEDLSNIFSKCINPTSPIESVNSNNQKNLTTPMVH